jgi:hypothetical protein
LWPSSIIELELKTGEPGEKPREKPGESTTNSTHI